MNNIIEEKVCESIFTACERNELEKVIAITNQHNKNACTPDGFYFSHLILIKNIYHF